MKSHALFVIFEKKQQNFNCLLLQIIGGALWVSLMTLPCFLGCLMELVGIQRFNYEEKKYVAVTKESHVFCFIVSSDNITSFTL